MLQIKQIKKRKHDNIEGSDGEIWPNKRISLSRQAKNTFEHKNLRKVNKANRQQPNAIFDKTGTCSVECIAKYYTKSVLGKFQRQGLETIHEESELDSALPAHPFGNRKLRRLIVFPDMSQQNKHKKTVRRKRVKKFFGNKPLFTKLSMPVFLQRLISYNMMSCKPGCGHKSVEQATEDVKLMTD